MSKITDPLWGYIDPSWTCTMIKAPRTRKFRIYSNCGIGPVSIEAKSYKQAIEKLVKRDGKAMPFLGLPIRITAFGRRVDWNENVLFLNPL